MSVGAAILISAILVVSYCLSIVTILRNIKLSRRIDWIEDRVEDLLLLQRKEMEK